MAISDQRESVDSHQAGLHEKRSHRNGPWRIFNLDELQLSGPGEFWLRRVSAGAYAHRKALEEANSPLLKSPFLRDENFVRSFGNAFFAAKQNTYAAVLHTGPIGRTDPDSSHALLPGRMASRRHALGVLDSAGRLAHSRSPRRAIVGQEFRFARRVAVPGRSTPSAASASTARSSRRAAF